jgi:hypothetical protein
MLIDLAHFLAGAFLVNALPHLINGLSGRPFPTPFAKPPGRGLSSPLVNVLWAAFNLVAGFLLIAKVGSGSLATPADQLIAAAGGLLLAIFLAIHFGRVFSGNAAGKP